MKRLLTIAAILFTVNANAQFNFIKTNTKEFDRISSDEVLIILDKNKVPKDAEEVGLIVCKSDKDKKVFSKAKSLAAKHGANCIYIMEKDEATSADKWRAAMVGGSGGKDKTTFVAIRTKK